MRESFWMRTYRKARRAFGQGCALGATDSAAHLSIQERPDRTGTSRLRGGLLCFPRRWHVLSSEFFATWENVSPDFEFTDFGRSIAPNDTNNLHTNHANDPVPPVADAAQILSKKTKFCAFIASTSYCATRHRFVEVLSHHMHVDAAGPVLRCSRPAPPRHGPDHLGAARDFYRAYKFVIAFENSVGLHYTSEKIRLAFEAEAVPIYWGNPHVAHHCNPERFINAFDFDNLESLAAHVMRVHKDDALYLRYLSAPVRTPRQGAGEFTNCRYYVNLPDIARGFRTERKVFFGFYQRVTEKHRKGFLHQYIDLMTGRMLPLAQRRMFHRECLSRFAHEACHRLINERLKLAGARSDLPQSGRHVTSHRRVWPHPAFYQVVDMHGRLNGRD